MDEGASQLKKFQKELSSGTMSLVLLAVLGQSRQPMYGYQIARRLEQVG
ncbi:MAG: PadR family transcriptional regulator, partial [Rhodanobacter sp.]